MFTVGFCGMAMPFECKTIIVEVLCIGIHSMYCNGFSLAFGFFTYFTLRVWVILCGQDFSIFTKS